MTRQENNLQLVAHLFNLIEEQPDLRFSQIMAVYGFTREVRPVNHADTQVDWCNEFYTEPAELLERVLKRIKDISEA